jgi:nickel-dependent lactate racemase
MKTVRVAYGAAGLDLRVPKTADVLVGQNVEAIQRPAEAAARALAHPIGSAPLADLIAARQPQSVAITISDITRPVPNRDFLPPLLDCLNSAGIGDRQIVIIIGTGMHRASTPQEREVLVGPEMLRRIEVIDHSPHDPSALLRINDDPPVSVNRRFAEADFRIVTGFIEPHFMAGYSGGRKGVCPALVDLATIQRFHGYATLADPRADNGILEGNPCHEIALRVARTVGVDFLLNVAITRDRRIAGIYAGDLEAAHEAGCRQVAEWTSAGLGGPYDLVVTGGGGLPLDATFYQAIKGMCGALPALAADSTLLIVSECRERLGSKAFTELMLANAGDWRRFLADVAASKETRLDQWEFQMQCRVLARIGVERLWLVSEGSPPDVQRRIGVTPILGEGDAQQRAQRAIDAFVAERPNARVAVIPDGPYTMLRNTVSSP